LCQLFTPFGKTETLSQDSVLLWSSLVWYGFALVHTMTGEYIFKSIPLSLELDLIRRTLLVPCPQSKIDPCAKNCLAPRSSSMRPNKRNTAEHAGVTLMTDSHSADHCIYYSSGMLCLIFDPGLVDWRWPIWSLSGGTFELRLFGGMRAMVRKPGRVNDRDISHVLF